MISQASRAKLAQEAKDALRAQLQRQEQKEQTERRRQKAEKEERLRRAAVSNARHFIEGYEQAFGTLHLSNIENGYVTNDAWRGLSSYAKEEVRRILREREQE